MLKYGMNIRPSKQSVLSKDSQETSQQISQVLELASVSFLSWTELQFA